MISHGSKLPSEIVVKWVNDKRLEDTELAFRKGKGMADGVFLLRNISKRRIRNEKGLNLCYAEAFNGVKHTKLTIDGLTKAGIPNNVKRLIVGLTL